MTRVETIGDCTLHLGDCRDILPTLGKVDAVVTDPPYGIGFKYAGHDDRPEAYDGGYGAWLWGVLEKCEDLLPDGAPIFVWQASLNVRQFSNWFPRNWRLFCAAKNFVQMRPTAMQYAYDPVVVWWKSDEKGWSAGTANRDWHVANTAPVVATPDNVEKGHPCPRPADQIAHVVRQWVPPTNTVLDPFMGSGTTGVAALKLGRKFIGIEREPTYFDIACKRIANAYRQPRLFDDVRPTSMTQADMLAGEP